VLLQICLVKEKPNSNALWAHISDISPEHKNTKETEKNKRDTIQNATVRRISLYLSQNTGSERASGGKNEFYHEEMIKVSFFFSFLFNCL
jgi:hypothetical protein